MIIVSKTHFNQMVKHALSDYPHECCGGLLGTFDTHTKHIKKVVELSNQWDDTDSETKRRRFKITPSDYKKLEQLADDAKLHLLGFYHSHPDHPAIPSETDLSYAWPFFSYPIISIMQSKYADIQSYYLDQGQLQKEAVKLLD